MSRVSAVLAKRLRVRFGSKADICSAPTYVRFTLESGLLGCRVLSSGDQLLAYLGETSSLSRFRLRLGDERSTDCAALSHVVVLDLRDACT